MTNLDECDVLTFKKSEYKPTQSIQEFTVDINRQHMKWTLNSRSLGNGYLGCHILMTLGFTCKE
jgi:hypothetical protein